MEVQRRATKTGGIFECMDYCCYYPIPWPFSMENIRVDCGYTHLLFLFFFRRFARLAPDLQLDLLSKGLM